MNFAFKKYILVIICCCACSFATAQQTGTKGKEFWLGFMANFPGETPILTLQITGEKATNGLVEIPGQGFLQPFNVVPNTVTSIDIPVNLAYDTTSEVIEKMGIYILALDSISVYASNVVPATTDATIILPLQSLGQEYYIMSIEQGSAPQFMVVATDSNTVVEITPKALTVGGKPPGVPFTVTLHKGEVYQVQSTLVDLTGSFVRSVSNCKPIAVFSGNRCAQVPAGVDWCDHIVEQLYPMKTWGKNYFTVPLITRGGDTYRIMAAQDMTTFTINGGASQTLLMAGDFIQYQSTDPSYIQADKPVSVAQFSNGGSYDNATGDPFLLMVVPEEQTLKKITFNSIPGNNVNHYLNVVMKTADKGTFTVNGTNVSALFKPFPFKPEYSYLQNTLSLNSTVANAYTIEADSGFTAYVYGFGTADSYGYAAGSDLKNLNLSVNITNALLDSPRVYCINDSIRFQGFAQFPPDSFSWNFGDGTVSSLQHPAHLYPDTGTYQVTLMAFYNGGTCTNDLKQVTIHLSRPEAMITGNDTLCYGDSTFLKVTGGTSWLWNTGAVSDSIRIKAEKDTFYTVTAFHNGCASLPDTFRLYVTTPLANAGMDTGICRGDSIMLNASGGTAYQWNPSSGLSDPSVSNPYAKPSVTTRYYVTASVGTCTSVDSIMVYVNEPLPIPSIHCGINMLDSVQFIWNVVQGSTGYEVSLDKGTSWIQPNSGSGSMDTVHGVGGLLPGDSVAIFVKALGVPPCGASVSSLFYCYAAKCPEVSVHINTDKKDIRPPETVEIEAKVSGGIGPFTYSWSPDIGNGPGPYTIMPEEYVYYKVILKDEGAESCPAATDSIRFGINDEFYFYLPDAFSPNGDGINDEFTGTGKQVKSYRMQVFNRWGELVFSSAAMNSGWKGCQDQSCMQAAPSGTYIYMVNVYDSQDKLHTYCGTVSLVR